MTQFNAPQQVPPVPQTPKTHVLAILSLICAFLICIPVIAPVFGLLFGFIAVILIARSNGLKTGKGMAAAGIVISLVVLGAQIGLGVVGYNVVKKTTGIMLEDFKGFVQAVETEDYEAARGYLDSTALVQITDDQFDDLRDRLKDEYGTLNSASFDWFSNAIQQGAPYAQSAFNFSAYQGAGQGTTVSMTLSFKAEFTNKTAFGVVQLDATEGQSGTLSGHITQFTLIGDDGPWTFPPPEY